MARKKEKHGLADALLTLIDWICEGVGYLAVAILRALGRGLLLLARGLGRLALLIARGLAAPFVWLFRRLTARNRRAAQCLRLTGEEFEEYVALVLGDNGFRHVEVTRASGDQGVDILAERGGKMYAIQCKNYKDAVGNFAVQEAFAGAEFYGCDAAAVICPGTFTRAARELAASTGVLLWDGEHLSRMMRRSGRRPKHRLAQAEE